jgi:hypothetical protein
MAVAAVGDIDVEEMEQRIIDAFGDLPTVDQPRAFERDAYSPAAEPRATGFGDEEAARGRVTIVWPTAGAPMETAGEFRGRTPSGSRLASIRIHPDDRDRRDRCRGETRGPE